MSRASSFRSFTEREQVPDTFPLAASEAAATVQPSMAGVIVQASPSVIRRNSTVIEQVSQVLAGIQDRLRSHRPNACILLLKVRRILCFATQDADILQTQQLFYYVCPLLFTAQAETERRNPRHPSVNDREPTGIWWQVLKSTRHFLAHMVLTTSETRVEIAAQNVCTLYYLLGIDLRLKKKMAFPWLKGNGFQHEHFAYDLTGVDYATDADTLVQTAVDRRIDFGRLEESFRDDKDTFAVRYFAAALELLLASNDSKWKKSFKAKCRELKINGL
jgi:hypothetical protein